MRHCLVFLFAMHSALGLFLSWPSSAAAGGDQPRIVRYTHLSFGEEPMLNEQVGRALATGDWNGDGKEDLAIGVPLRDEGGAERVGAVWVFYHGGNTEVIIPFAALIYDGLNFGAALLGADLDQDGYDELLIGTPGYRVDGVASGALIIRQGGPGGIQPGNEILPLTSAQEGRRLGSSLAILGRWVAVGAPGDVISGEDSGAIYMVAFDDGEACHYTRFDQDTAGVPGISESGDSWGSAMAFSSTGVLWLGAPGEDIGDVSDAGAMWSLVFGATVPCEDIPLAASALFFQGDGIFQGTAEDGDQFGASIAVAELRGLPQVIVGVPREDDESLGLGDTGCVHIWEGGGTPSPCLLADQLGPDIAASSGQRTGAALASGDIDGDGFGDLMVGAPGADHTFGRQGAVLVSRGSSSRQFVPFATVWDDPAFAHSFEEFGSALAFLKRPSGVVGNPLIGVPGFDAEGQDRAGTVVEPRFSEEILIFYDGFEQGTTDQWSESLP